MPGPYQLIESGPPFTPLRFGLLSAATQVDDPDPHWQLGGVVLLDACGVPATVTGGPCSATGISKEPSVDGLDASASEPFSVYAWIPCSPVGHGDQLEDLFRRTEVLLTNGEARAVEHVVWTGEASNGLVRPHLASDTQVMAQPMGALQVELQSAATVVTTGTPVSITEGISLVEAELAACYGGEGVIHVPAAAAIHLSNVGVVTRQGAQLRTLLGNVVALYSSGDRTGPDGTDPAAGSAWIYGTGSVMVRRGPIKPGGIRPADIVGKSDNSTVYILERSYLVDWGCCHIAAEVRIPGLGAT